ncbi:MAG: mechanosensitive ion channel family protein [Chitinispirillales bacterium]|jgi:miniconductance mechanosensitive channel|nr:mechanosensitive ion channel family protein [Chitinispirillales bacterium]
MKFYDGKWKEADSAMKGFMEYFLSVLSDVDIVIHNVTIPMYTVSLLILAAAAAGVYLIAVNVFLPILNTFIRRTNATVADALSSSKLLRRAFHLIPATILAVGLPVIMGDAGEREALGLAPKALGLYYVLIGLAIFDALLSATRNIFDKDNERYKKVGLTGALQALKIVGLIVAVILAVSILAGKSPVYFLSGLGAFTAILMLIFRDPILGLVAGVQLSAMDLVRKGDWVDIPKHGADGTVVDITLTTVKVSNWDKTFTAIPAYELVANSFKNWRGMFESGGRRIKRSIRFSARSVRFLTDEEIQNLRKIKLIEKYIVEKTAEICNYNEAEFSEEDLCMQTNGRRLTNIGTYRAYCDAYLRHHPGINQDMMIMVRQLQPTELGLPLEIYAFTSDVMWVGHENTQSNIFDHFISIVPEFGLEMYQR